MAVLPDSLPAMTLVHLDPSSAMGVQRSNSCLVVSMMLAPDFMWSLVLSQIKFITLLEVANNTKIVCIPFSEIQVLATCFWQDKLRPGLESLLLGFQGSSSW